MAKETIKSIKGFSDYYISDKGIAYTTKIAKRYNPNGEMKVLRPRIHPSGYLYLGLFKGKGPSKQRIWKRVHRVVWETFVGKIPTGLEIDHINCDKHDNRISNLRVVTHSENCKNRKRKKKV
jgi:hypothetical protein